MTTHTRMRFPSLRWRRRASEVSANAESAAAGRAVVPDPWIDILANATVSVLLMSTLVLYSLTTIWVSVWLLKRILRQLKMNEQHVELPVYAR